LPASQFQSLKVDANSMKSDLHEMDESGKLAENPGMTLEYKHQKEPAPKKEDAKPAKQ
jgi:hypothetical protein